MDARPSRKCQWQPDSGRSMHGVHDSMKRLLLLLLLSGSPAWAATYYVDGNCPSAGNGTSITCGASGPKTLISAGLALMAAGDTLNVRGVHSTHDGESVNFDGRYYGNEWGISLTCNSGSPCVVQPYNGEIVYLDGTRASSAGWTQCST